jgi:hypothetical protein
MQQLLQQDDKKIKFKPSKTFTRSKIARDFLDFVELQRLARFFQDFWDILVGFIQILGFFDEDFGILLEFLEPFEFF